MADLKYRIVTTMAVIQQNTAFGSPKLVVNRLYAGFLKSNQGTRGCIGHERQGDCATKKS